MKRMLPFVLAACLLLAPVVAQAYAIYNHVDHKVCVQTEWSQFFENCKYLIPAHGVHNGAHGSGMGHVQVVYLVDHGTKCRCNQESFDIPKGGYARIYDDVVKVYKHDDSEVDRKSISNCDCYANKDSKK